MSAETFRARSVTVAILRAETNDMVIYADTIFVNAGYDGLFNWQEGNMSCDCNRELKFRRLRGEPDGERPCSEGRYAVMIIADGDEIWRDQWWPKDKLALTPSSS